MSVNYCFIDTTKELHRAAEQLSQSRTFYIDTEFEQGGTKLCLIQISSGAEIYLIDTLRLSAMAPLIDAITGDDSEWVLHSGKKDLELLTQKFRLTRLPRIFDTQIAWGLLHAESNVSLAYLNYNVLNLRTPKEHQASPWDIRPLPDPQLEYAASDVKTLPQLQGELVAMLQEQDKHPLVYEVSQELYCPAEKAPAVRPKASIAAFRNAWELDYGSQAALHFLIDWWNSTPPEQLPPGMKPNSLFQIARRMPESGEELARIKGVPGRWARQYGDLLTGRLIRASYNAQEHEYPPIEPQPYLTFREVQFEAFLFAAKYAVSKAATISPDIGFPPPVMHGLKERLQCEADIRGAADELAGWRQRWLAPPYLDFCERWETFDRQIVTMADGSADVMADAVRRPPR